MKDLDFIDQLMEKAIKMKTDILMEEPCPIYDGDAEDWEDFWFNEDENNGGN